MSRSLINNNNTMDPKVQKNMYEVEFRSVKYPGESNKVLNIVAIDFVEAIKKANEVSEKAKSAKDDIVEVVRIEFSCTIDAE